MEARGYQVNVQIWINGQICNKNQFSATSVLTVRQVVT